MADSPEQQPSSSPADASANGAPSPTSTNGQYGSDQIKVLEGLEAVRKRPGMYIGGTGVNALHHLVYEVVDNSIDEAMAGYASLVTVTVLADGTCRVTDDGRGIPVEPMRNDDPALDGKPAVEVVMTKLHAGGKFQQEGSAYKVSGGLHGVGVSCVNALSDMLEVEVWREGEIHAMEFSRGEVTKPLAKIGPMPENASRPSGTTVTFRPDPTIFPVTDFVYDTLLTRLRELAYLNPGVTIRLSDERVGPDGEPRSDEFCADNGLLEYVTHLMAGKSEVSSPVYLKREDEDRSMICEVAMQYHNGYNELLLTFANNINNVDGGTHGQGFKVALTRTLNGYARKAGIIKDKDPTPTGDDLREGLIAIVSVKLPNPAFNNQPKEKLLNPEIETFVGQAVSEALETWLEEHPSEAKKLCQKGIIAAQAREAARKARELTRRKTALDSGSMPHKLRDCKTKDVDRAELFIVEGDSAGGSATQGRDVETQAILPLRGKLLNVERARIDKILGFEEIRTLIAALRCGIGADFDIAKLRYGKVVIMTDADVDGSHIRTLLLTFFFRQMPELIKRGHVFIAQPPLYQLIKGKTGRYVLNESTLADTLTELGLEGSSLVVRDLDADRASKGEAVELRRLEGEDVARAVQKLRRLGDLVEVAERRGVPFPDLLSTRSNDPTGEGRLPTHRVTWRGSEAFAWSEAQALEFIRDNGMRLEETAIEITEEGGAAIDEVGDTTEPEAPVNADGPVAVLRELHENKELAKIFADLAAIGLDVDDWALVREESVTGEKMPARFAWETTKVGKGSAAKSDAARSDAVGSDDDAEESASASTSPTARVVEAANLHDVLPALHEIGRRGMEIKRFKGLGEMDAEQLWDTTMDVDKRVFMRVTWDMAGEADGLFSVLMGEEVEPRRKFIERHALEVKNLDV